MPFPLVRYFGLTSLFFFIAVGGVLGYYYREMALSGMLQQQESGNSNLTTVFANALWQKHFSALISESRELDSQELKKNSRLREIHADVLALMRNSTTYKIKVYDPRGRTIYSSELAQIGEDKAGNAGFQGAMGGSIRTELVHKEKFSAFEQIIENRDLIQSYIPQYEQNSPQAAGVFEIYSDATPFLAEIRRTETTLWWLITGLLGTLFGALFLIVRRADRIIRQQASEKLNTEQQLAQSEKMASLGQLVAGVSHQLNTPIGFSHNNVNLAITALEELTPSLLATVRLGELLSNLPADDPNGPALLLNEARRTLGKLSFKGNELKEIGLMLGDVLDGLEQMRELVTNLRDFTHLDRSKIAEADLNATLKTVIYIARSSIPTRIGIVEELGVLPRLACNPSQLNQVFLNLITNAAQAIPDQGQIFIRTRHDAGEIGIEIADTGTGIPQEVMPRIFETFYTTKPCGIGTGLGLSIAKDIIENHGGRISVDSEVGRGTTFRITLPLFAPVTLPAL